MTEWFGIVLAALALGALLGALGLFCHGLLARRQMQRCKKSMPLGVVKAAANTALRGRPAAIP